ncbi:twin-arginine translocase subunit TatC [Porticoccus sp. W117]|uniref:twin-arginine translocase subunit TatC n=1 Tax=Porticoccus sp. W117 TaxID=3054777 RepID=UPI002594A5D6|nr:twin-arginine translocase subunit TatC [Porticoccus sp. W117]MDM3871583.1 twin-arginine translocase subunit TatC [Porticoccus sp. W117]
MSSDEPSNSEAAEQDQHKQPLVAHLIELRDRLLRILLVVLLLFAGLFAFSNDIYEFVSAPLRAALPEGSTMIATNITASFFAPLKLTFAVAIFIAVPYILSQLWGFIAPGLYSRERKMAMPILLSSIVLFYAGVAFAYYVIFPLVWLFFTSTGPLSIQMAPDITSYLEIALKLFFAFGIAFEIPIATMLLIFSGAISPKKLVSKRPYIVVGCFVVAMLLTPPDPISQCLLAVPMWLLFEAGVFFGRWIKKAPVETEAG